MLLKKLVKVSQLCHDIRNSNLEEEKQYDLIFSDNISTFVFNLCRENDNSLSYYDPDTSYEEDMDAFINALDEKIEVLKEASNDDTEEYSVEASFLKRAKKLRN